MEEKGTAGKKKFFIPMSSEVFQEPQSLRKFYILILKQPLIRLGE